MDPDKGLPVSRGVITDRFGNRNSPASAYAMYAPKFDEVEEVGGQFWDGRATGEVLGDPLADQALGPFLNPVEMNNPDRETVIADALGGDYGDLFIEVCGDGSDVEAAYNCIAMSIAAFERTALFGQFSSKYDAYLQACLDLRVGTRTTVRWGSGTRAEEAGGDVFTQQRVGRLPALHERRQRQRRYPGTGEGAACVACHVADWIDPADYGRPRRRCGRTGRPMAWCRPCSPILPTTTWACPRAPTDSCGTNAG